MQRKSRLILMFPLLFVLLTLQTACSYWVGTDRSDLVIEEPAPAVSEELSLR